jgi:uncharacterized protein (DUF488 family)
MTNATARGLVGVGYEGRALTDFIDGLVADHVNHLVDVRLTPISRKRGFSKTALCHALAEAGIGYQHRPELGNPKPNRAGFAGDERQVDQARATFLGVISQPAAIAAIEDLAALAQRERVALLCFEADQGRCHRDVVIQQVEVRSVSGLDSKRPAR